MIKNQITDRLYWQLVIILLILTMFVSANADWSIYKKIEHRSKEGHIFRIDINYRRTIQAWLILKKTTAGVFETKMPLYRVDTNDVHDLRLIKNISTDKDRWIAWVISVGKGKPSPDLIELMNGREVTFQYYLPDGTIKETTFDLKGAREAIEEILK